MANTNNRPGNMETVYENRKTLEYGKIISYNDHFKTLMIELSDGKATSMTWSTFRSTWRKKVEEIIEDQKEEIVEENLVPMPGIEKLEELKKEVEQPKVKPARKSGKPRKMIEYNGKSQGICAWARELGLNANTLYNRMYYKHMTFEEAISVK